MVSEASLRYAA